MAVVSGGGSTGLSLAHKTLTSAQILALNTTEIAVIAAPGANRLIVPYTVIARVNFGTAAYATQTALYYAIGSTQAVGAPFLTHSNASFLAQTVTTFTATDFAAGMDGTMPTVAGCVNLAFQVGTGGNGNPTAGDGTVDLWVFYQVLAVA